MTKQRDGVDYHPVACAACGAEFHAARSVYMERGVNRGHARCPACGTLLHLEMSPDLGGDRMASEPYAAWSARAAGRAPAWETQ